jgi:wyosine [tRNA(Phe)-imidazoG37] synthetase (radical SAM superfamily)
MREQKSHSRRPAYAGTPPASVSRHARKYRGNSFVYPVLSRRARGVSIGINLNPDKICNWDCIYCQVDRTTPPALRDVDESLLRDELRAILEEAKSGALFERPEFRQVADELRVLRDITFAGDGEPCSYPNFLGVVRDTVRLKEELGFSDLKVVLLSNATLLDRPRVKEALALMDGSCGEFWLKLDAGTEGYYRLIDRTMIPFRKVLDNILKTAMLRPVVLQSLFMKVRGDAPSRDEIGAYCDRVREILDEGGGIKLIQIYTVARPPAESFVAPLSEAEVDALADDLRRCLPVPIESFYSNRLS